MCFCCLLLPHENALLLNEINDLKGLLLLVKNAKLNNKVSNNPASSKILYWKYFAALIPAPIKIFCFINLQKIVIFDKMCLLLIQPLKVNMSTIISIFLSEFCTDLAMRYSDYPNQTNWQIFLQKNCFWNLDQAYKTVYFCCIKKREQAGPEENKKIPAEFLEDFPMQLFGG